MSPKKPKRVAIYARLSLTTEESVSVARQIEAAEKYADARGWTVVLTAVDDGVSATKKAPGMRPGWREILAYDGPLDAVIVWKVDRLARKVIDFLTADQALQERGAGIVAVEDPIDMTTPQGRAFAVMLSVFAELESANTAARVKAARDFMARNGRAVGNRPWPYESVPAADGSGLVWRPIPERAAAVLEAVEGIVGGTASLASVARDWTDRGFPLPNVLRDKATGEEIQGRVWNPATVRVLLTNPVLTGATMHRGALLRNPDGTIARDPERAILTPAQHKAIVAAVAERKHRDGARPIRLPLLHGLAVCSGCGKRMVANRPSDPAKPHTYVCQNKACQASVSISLRALEEYVVAEFEKVAADVPVVLTAAADTSAEEDEIVAALAEISEALDATDDDDDALALLAQRKALRARLAEIRDAAETATESREFDLATEWLNAGEDETNERRTAILAEVFERVVVLKGERKRGFRPERVRLERRGE